MNTSNSCVSQIINFIDQLKSGSKTERNRVIVKRYLGLDGRGGSSMEVAGEPYGLTRESVRQILKKYKDAINESKLSFQSLKEALNILDKISPSSSATAELHLVSLGILDDGFAIEGILLASDFIGLKKTKNEVSIVKEKSSRSDEYTVFVVTNSQTDLPKSIYSQALKETSHNGASSVLHICETLTAPKASRETLVRDIVNSIPGVIWLDSEENWFYFLDQARNRVISRIKKIFSVFNDVVFENAKEGIRRSINKHNEEISRRLPNHVLKSLLNAEGYELIDGKLHSNIQLLNSELFNDDERKILDFEMRILDVLKLHPTETIQEAELENIIVETGKDKFPFSMALNHSPLIYRVKRGTYRAIGNLQLNKSIN